MVGASNAVLAETSARNDLDGHRAGSRRCQCPNAAGLTGKERLSEKWKDEQRIDNCKVPIDKRGAKARPDSCEHPPKN